MQRRQFLSHVLTWGFAGAAACGVPGCGTLLHGERRGQLHSNQLDWGIVALDGLGLLLFFVPGVVAFAVDFATGAIYLPLEPASPVYQVPPPPPSVSSWQQAPTPQSTTPKPAAVAFAAQEQSTWQWLGLRRVVLPREQLERERIEQIATHYVGRPVSLDSSETRVSILSLPGAV